MALTEELRNKWIWNQGPWLYWHFSNARLWPWVLRDGIQPRTVTGQTGQHLNMKSRPGHVYLLTQPTPAARLAADVIGEAQVRVDLRRLHLDRMATDEDRVGAKKPLAQQRDVVKDLSDWAHLPERQPSEQVGDWMNTNAGIVDAPDWVFHSMTEYTVAHRGGIPAHLCEWLPLYLLDDWEEADPNELYVEVAPGQRAQHYKGDLATQP